MEKNIVLCICGSGATLGITEYIAFLTAKFKHVRIILTENGEKILPISSANMICEHVYSDNVSFSDKEKNHINLARWADIVIVIPATANIIGKISNGIADTFMTTFLISFNGNVLIYPCMNNLMWKNIIVQRNIKKLENTNYKIIVRDKKECFEIASGKMKKNIVLPSLEELFNDIKNILGRIK
ncbi:flavoprotein [Ligilactobacillus cholophilus]|uniref:flavoprotein n=1 Tax=Ligilactobacillus cholophilus TaxID=3050131 RepID=UPI0025AFEF5E|nr:flavoprotein [Ligilactobacillus cholophilus]